MKKYYHLLCILMTLCTAKLVAVQSNTFVDYQNFNHGYCSTCNCYPCKCDTPNNGDCGDGGCPTPNPCNPAPVCGTECGVSVAAVGAAIVLVAAVGALIVGLSNNSSTTHAHNP